MELSKELKTIDIELALMKYFDYRRNIIIPNLTANLSTTPFETDLLILTKDGYATGVEIKISKSDLLNDKNKVQFKWIDDIIKGEKGFERYFKNYKYFYYAVPEWMESFALNNIPEFCGLMIIKKGKYTWREGDWTDARIIRKPKHLFNKKWSDKQIYDILRLGTMRIYSSKVKINNLNNKNG